MSGSTTAPGGQHVDEATAAAVLEVRDVAVHYGGIKAVDGVSLRLAAGKVFGILGPNGSGKSTLLAALTRLTNVTRGELLFDGRPYHRSSTAQVPRLGIARTFQTARLLADLTVRDNIALGADLWQSGGRCLRRSQRAAFDSLIDETIERVGLTGLERLRPGELSYGYQRRVEIGRAIALRPRLLLLDEPTAGMNRGERAEISALLGRLREEGMTALLVEHDVQMMVDTCDYLFAMNSGALIAEGAPRSVAREPAVQEAYLGKRWRDHASDH